MFTITLHIFVCIFTMKKEKIEEGEEEGEREGEGGGKEKRGRE